MFFWGFSWACTFQIQIWFENSRVCPDVPWRNVACLRRLFVDFVLENPIFHFQENKDDEGSINLKAMSTCGAGCSCTGATETVVDGIQGRGGGQSKGHTLGRKCVELHLIQSLTTMGLNFCRRTLGLFLCLFYDRATAKDQCQGQEDDAHLRRR